MANWRIKTDGRKKDRIWIKLFDTSGEDCSGGFETRLYVHSSFAIILIGALLSLSSWCLVMVVWLFLAVPWVCLRFVIVVFPDHTHLLFLTKLGA